VWVASLATIVPVLGGLVVLVAAIYSLYTFWIGLPKLMQAPADKAQGYAIVCILASIVAAVIIAVVFGMVQGMLFVGSMIGGHGFF
jgi:hypothetical protein